MRGAMKFFLCLGLAAIAQVFADDWETFAQRSISIEKGVDIPIDIFDIERELLLGQPTSRPTKKGGKQPTRAPTKTRQPTHKATNAAQLLAAKNIQVTVAVTLTMSNLACGDFNTRRWQRAFKKFLKGKLQLWKTHYLGFIKSNLSDCNKKQGNDDAWDDKMKSPTMAPATTRSRRLDTQNTLSLNIQATGTPLSAITAGLNNVAANGVNLAGYPPSTAKVTVTSTSVSSGAAGSSGPSLCFGAGETVALESGESKMISDVEVGDRILAVSTAGDFVYSDVVFVPHAKNSVEAEFTQIITESGRDVKMTGLHMIPAGPCSTSGTLPLVYANTVVPGNCISTVNGLERVSEVQYSVESGVYTVVAMDEMIVVNGIVASPFGVSHTFANIYYNLHRFMYRSLPMSASTKAIRDVNNFVGKMIFSVLSA